MPSTNFGAIFSFAEELEKQDMDFYVAAAANPGCAEYQELFTGLVKNCKKNLTNAQRARRECVSEMILEPIEDLDLAEFCEAMSDPSALDAAAVLTAAKGFEQRAERFYQTAAQKIQVLPDGAQVLKSSAKMRARNRKMLDEQK